MRFINPLEGKQVPLLITPLFQLDPQVLAKLLLGSVNAYLRAEGYESFLKGMKRVVSEKRAPSKRLVRQMEVLLGERFPLLIKALHGDVDAKKIVENIGQWEAFCKGLVTEGDRYSYKVSFMIDLERECWEPYKLIVQGQHANALQLLQQSKIARLFLWPQAIKIIQSFDTEKAWLPIRASLMFETVLSYLAALDAEQCCEASQHHSWVKDVLPTSSTANQNPITLLFKWVCSQVNVQGPTALFKTLDPASFPDPSFTKRWSSGSHMPSYENFIMVCKQLDIPVEHEGNEAVIRYAGAKMLNFLGFYANAIVKDVEKSAQETWGTWPLLPFDCRDINNWFETRYPYWFDYHQKQLSAQKN